MKKIIKFFMLFFAFPVFGETCTDASCTPKSKPTHSKPSKQELSKTPKKQTLQCTFPIQPEALEQFLQRADSISIQVPVVIKVGASWCEPCTKSIPAYESLAENYTPCLDAFFFYITVDEKPALTSDYLQDLQKALKIKLSSIPSFIIMYRGEVHVITGSEKIEEIATTIKRLHKKYPRVKAINSKTIEHLVYKSKQPVILKLHAAWCPPCSYMEPIFEEVEKIFKNKCTFLRLDTVGDEELAQKLMQENGLQGIPLFLFYKNGRVVKKFAGTKSKEAFTKEIELFLNL